MCRPATRTIRGRGPDRLAADGRGDLALLAVEGDGAQAAEDRLLPGEVPGLIDRVLAGEADGGRAGVAQERAVHEVPLVRGGDRPPGGHALARRQRADLSRSTVGEQDALVGGGV